MVSRDFYDAALQRMNAGAMPELMRWRRCTVEYPFGLLKHQVLEKPRLLLRGLWGAGTEMALATPAGNLKRAMAVPGSGGMMARLAGASASKQQRPASRALVEPVSDRFDTACSGGFFAGTVVRVLRIA